MSIKDITRRQHSETFTRITAEDHEFQLVPFTGKVLEVEDMHFHHDSAVLLPNCPSDLEELLGGPSLGLSVIAECLLHQKQHPDDVVLIAGHADTSGPDQYNIGISQKRAKAVQHAIMGEREDWIAISKGQHKTEDYQLILTWVALVYGWDCDPQGVDNINGDHTKKAVKHFQERYNREFEADIDEDGKVGHDTWGAFFDVYMDMVQNLCETDEEGMRDLRAKMRFIGPKIVGCGENWPVEEPQRPNYRSLINRRVEILFFKSGEEPKLDCHPGGNACQPVLCEMYNLKMYRFDHLPVVPSLPKPTQVYLKLRYLDPEGNEKLFPEDFPVTVIYPDNTTQNEKVGADGVLHFGAQRKDSFTLRFESNEAVWIALSADDATNKLARRADLAQLHKDKFRFFSTPKTWTLVESKWTISANRFFKDDPEYRFFIPGRYGITIGDSVNPVDMKLDPHWSFLRLEFFDRHYGHSDHNNKQVNIPAMLVEGWRESPAQNDPDTTSHWALSEADVDRAVLAIPWIIQKKPDNTDDVRPNEKVQFGMKTDWLHATETAYVISKAANERMVETRPVGHEDLKPSERRLDYYDLPKVWKSDKYYTRFPDNTGDFFNNAANFAQKIKDSLKAPDKPLRFSLDDIVLVDNNLNFVTLAATEDPALFYHQFKDPGVQYNGKSISPVGIYSPGTDLTKNYFPYSDIQLPVRHYIFEYPNWVRVIAAQGGLFDVFDWRTRASDPIAGARAAVRWVNTSNAALGVPANGVFSPRPGRTNHPGTDPSFAIQPFFELETDNTRAVARSAGAVQEWSSPHAPSTIWHVGRFDIVLLRNCEIEAGDEIMVNMHFFRFFLNFSSAPATINQQNYRRDVTNNIPKRWNGPDSPYNAHPPKLLPDGNPAKLQGKIYWFVQDVPLGRQHYNITVQASTAPGASRAHMSARNGTGGFNENTSNPDAGGRFVAAHECGHGDALYDEYNERWSLGSYYQPSYATWMPGDPFERDTDAIMNHNRDVKPRHYWHAAEWLRVTTNINLKMDFGGAEYTLPRHPNTSPLRIYVLWPIWSENQVQGAVSGVGARRNFDVFLYPLGNEDYARALVPGKDLRGLMLVEVKIEVSFDDPAILFSQIRDGVRDLFSGVDNFFNNTIAVVVDNATIPGVGVDLSPCAVKFTPRFLVSTFPSNLGNNAERSALRSYFNGQSIQVGGAFQVCPAADPARATYLTSTAPGLYNTHIVTSVRNNHAQGHFRLNIRNTYTNGWQGGGNNNQLRLIQTNLTSNLRPYFGDMVGLDTGAATVPHAEIKNRILNGIVKRVLTNATLA